MRGSFEVLEKGHTLVDFGHLVRVGTSERFDWDFDSSTNATYAAIAHDRGELAGILKWREIINSDGETWFESIATFVWPRFRHGHLARSLWDVLLDETCAREVRVGLVSDRGLTLIESVKARHPRVRFCITESGERKLRCLKG